jgi:hypothetical protein
MSLPLYFVVSLSFSGVNHASGWFYYDCSFAHLLPPANRVFNISTPLARVKSAKLRSNFSGKVTVSTQVVTDG